MRYEGKEVKGMQAKSKQASSKQTTRSEPAYSYRRLDVWERSQEMAAEVIRLVRVLPKDPATFAIGRQLVASAGSVGANIAEGHGRYSLAAYRNHLSIARGSACESGSWLDLLRRTDYIDAAHEDEIHQDISSIVAILTSKMRGLSAQLPKRPAGKISEDAEPYLAQLDDDLEDLEAFE